MNNYFTNITTHLNGRNFLKTFNLTSYAIIFGQRTCFSIIKLVSRGKREFYLLYYNVIFKYRVLFKQTQSSIKTDVIVVKRSSCCISPGNFGQNYRFVLISRQNAAASTDTFTKKFLGHNFALHFTFKNSAPFKNNKKL